MKRLIVIAVCAAMVLAALLCWHGLRREENPAADSSAALGLMLLDREAGLYVLAVTQDSPADRAGIHPGDVLLKAADAPLHEPAQLDALLGGGQEAIPLELHRDGKNMQLMLPIK